jgi:hypothetical protein
VPTVLSYLTPGLAWSADYVTLFDEAKGRIDVQGWVTLSNHTGTTFANADALLVAGNPGGGGGNYNRYRGNAPGAIRQAGTDSGTRERLGDYYLYPLPERTTIANAQTKQVSFLDVKGAPARKAYEYVNRWLGSNDDPRSAATVLKFSTSKEGGLGDQLPAGTIRVYMSDARGNPQFIGENNVPPAPMGSQMAIRTGDAFDVKVKTVVEERKRMSDTRWRTRMRYSLTNARPESVTVDLAQDGLWGDPQLWSTAVMPILGVDMAGSSSLKEPHGRTATYPCPKPMNITLQRPQAPLPRSGFVHVGAGGHLSDGRAQTIRARSRP